MTLKISLYLFFSVCATQLFSQYTLDTPDGKKVKLNKDGTWDYVLKDNSKNNNTGIPKSSTAKYTSRFKKYELWYNPNDWIADTTKKGNGYTWDAYFFSADYAIQGYCLDSRLSMPIESIEAGIREQWQAAGEIKSFKNNQDTLNNLPVTIYEMEYVQAGITYIYKGIVYSNIKGSFQLTVGTQKEIFEEDRNKIDLLLKGFTKK